MTIISERYGRVADTFNDRVREVPEGAWERPTPCDGWVARDVVRHLADWVPAFFEAGGAGGLATGPSVDDDPVGAWTAVDAAIRARLEDPAGAAAEVSHPRAGSHRFDDAVNTFVLGDVLVHTWDVARATGLDERLDPDLVREMLTGVEPMDAMLRSSGQYGARVEVPADADEQTRLIAFTGRQP